MIVVVALALLATFCVRANAAPRRAPATVATVPVSVPSSVAARATERIADGADDAAIVGPDGGRADDRRDADLGDLEDVGADESTGVKGACNCDPETVARIAAAAPPLAAIIAAADRTAGTAEGSDPTRSWRRRSRWSALIPWLSARVGNSQSWRDVNDPSIAAISGPPALSHAVSWDVRAGWKLEDLVFDPNEPRFETFELARRRERRKLAALASRAYFTWLRAAVAADRDVRWNLRMAEAAAQLDALTDGWFSRHAAR